MEKRSVFHKFSHTLIESKWWEKYELQVRDFPQMPANFSPSLTHDGALGVKSFFSLSKELMAE